MESEVKATTCPICTGPARLLGELGAMTWLRCRDCGIEWSESDCLTTNIRGS